MRSRRHRIRRLQQRQLASYRVLCKIEFHNLRRIPKRNKRAAAILRQLQRHRICRRHRIALRQIEAMLDCPARRIEQQHIVGKVICHQQLLRACRSRRPQWPPETARPGPLPRPPISFVLLPAASCSRADGSSAPARSSRPLKLYTTMPLPVSPFALSAQRVGLRTHAGVQVACRRG